MSFFDVEAVWIRSVCSFFFNDTATTEIYTLSLHDALPISATGGRGCRAAGCPATPGGAGAVRPAPLQSHRRGGRSEEHTSELQSQSNLVCRLLLEKKKKQQKQSDRLRTTSPREL